jgi:membrane associated rhomboid family serine protease
MNYRYFKYDTSYQPQQRIQFPRGSKVIISLIVINVVAFIIGMIFPNVVLPLFALDPASITGKLYLWQFISYMFLHGSLFHLFINMFSLFMFGTDLLNRWGNKRFLGYYFFTGIGAGLCAFLFTSVPTIGASGAIYGLLLAYAMAFPNRTFLIFFIFPMRAKYVAIIFGLFELLSSVTARADGIAHIAHLGGMLFGLLLLLGEKYIENRKDRDFKAIHQNFKFIPPKENEDVDKLLDKILKTGVESLTPQEKTKLYKAGKFFGKHYPTNSLTDKK